MTQTIPHTMASEPPPRHRGVEFLDAIPFINGLSAGRPVNALTTIAASVNSSSANMECALRLGCFAPGPNTHKHRPKNRTIKRPSHSCPQMPQMMQRLIDLFLCEFL